MSALTKRLRPLQIALLHRLDKRIARKAFRGSLDLTAAKIELGEVTIRSENRRAGGVYIPSPWAVLDWVHAALPSDKSNWTFVDLGAGLGRATISAGRQPYARVVGVEFAGELAAAGRPIVAGAKDLRAGSIEILHADAAQYVLPEGPVIVFLFDPFGPPVINAVAESIARSYAEMPRPIVIAYLRPMRRTVFEALTAFTAKKLDWRSGLLFRMFSPYRLRLYATPEALADWR